LKSVVEHMCLYKFLTCTQIFCLQLFNDFVVFAGLDLLKGNHKAGATRQILARVGLDDPGQKGDVLQAYQANIDDLAELKNRK
jgi:hypothetical protein